MDGASSIQFSECVKFDYKGIILFEPDGESFKRSKENIAHLRNAIIYNEAVSDFCGELGFVNNLDGSAHVSTKKMDAKVKTTTLDRKISEIPFIPTYIKMDIEGSELAALRGSVETIKKYKPDLAVCIYHKISDIWEVPIWIHKTNRNYKIYVRHYDTRNIFAEFPDKQVLSWELVCYAVQY